MSAQEEGIIIPQLAVRSELLPSCITPAFWYLVASRCLNMPYLVAMALQAGIFHTRAPSLVQQCGFEPQQGSKVIFLAARESHWEEGQGSSPHQGGCL